MSTAAAPKSASNSTISPKSHHTASPLLAPFLGPTFDPTAYLNTHLPTLSIPTPSHPILPSGSLTINDHATRTQPQLASLAALANQLSATLTDLTDDVLRSGARLAYAVELLRGEAAALREALREGLKSEIAGLVPGGLEAALARLEAAGAADAEDAEHGGLPGHAGDAFEGAQADGSAPSASPALSVPVATEPAALAKLRVLHRVRARLQEVITTFDAAMAWPLPPSTQSTNSTFVSVAPPTDPREVESEKQREERGQAAQSALRERVAAALAIKGPDGLRRAESIVQELRLLCEVWKGTAEEKPRVKFVDGLAKAVAERRTEEEQKGSVMPEAAQSVGGNSARENGKGAAASAGAAAAGAGKGAEEQKRGGLFGGLRRLRDEIYLD